MTNEQFQNEFLNPLVENFFSKLSDFQNVTSIEFFRMHKGYFRDFIFRKLPMIEYGRKMSKLEKQKEFVNYFFQNNSEYDLFKSELNLENKKVGFATPKSTKSIDNMLNDIQNYNKLKKMADNAKLMGDSKQTIVTKINSGTQPEIVFDWKYYLVEFLPIHLNLLHFLYNDTITCNSEGNNTIPEPDITSIKKSYRKEKQLFYKMSTNVAIRKKETVELYADYFMSKITAKIKQYHEIHLALGWGVTEAEYEKKSEVTDYTYPVIIKKYYRTYHRNG